MPLSPAIPSRPSARSRVFGAAATLLLAFCPSLPAQAPPKLTAPALIALAEANSPTLAQSIRATFSPKDLHDGTASACRGSDFFFALESPTLVFPVKQSAGCPMSRV